MTSSYKDSLRLWKARRMKAVKLRKQGLSHAEIGKRLTPPVSKQAVRLMLAKEGVA